MTRTAEQVLCRVHVSSAARHGDEPLYEWIVESARRLHLRGATVLDGILGLDSDGTLMEEHRWAISQQRPVVVEIVDEAPRIEALLAQVEPAFAHGVITLERAHVWHRKDGAAGKTSGRAVHVLATATSSAAREVCTMKIPEDGILLRIFIGERDRDPETGSALFEAIVRRARARNLAGATVLRGPMGFGRHSRVHTARMLDLSTDLPIVIEIVDAAEKIDAFLPEVDALVGEGLVTLEAVRVLKYESPETR